MTIDLGEVARAIGLAVFLFLVVAMVIGHLTSPSDHRVDPAIDAEVRYRLEALRGEDLRGP